MASYKKKKEYHTSAEQILKELPPAPQSVRRTILQTAKGYMILDRNAGVAVCTTCEYEFELYGFDGWNKVSDSYTDYFEYKHNAQGVCPHCGRDVTVKSVGMGRKKLKEKHRVLVPVQRGKTTYMTLTEVIVDFTGFSPQLRTWISALYKINDRELTYYKHHPDGYYPQWWELRRTFKLPPDPVVPYGCGYRSEWNTYACIPEGRNRLLTCDRLKYFNFWEYVREMEPEPEEFVGLIGQVWKYPAMEMLWKAGFRFMVAERAVFQTGFGVININGKTLPKIFRSDMQTVRDLKEMNADIEDVRIYKQALQEYGFRPETHREADIAKKLMMRKERLDCDLGRAVRYIAKSGITVEDWKDYYKELVKLGIKRKAKNLFPKNFREAHEKTSAQVKYVEDRELKENMRIMIERKKENGGIAELNGLLFILAETPEELNNEGKMQHHCVASYAERVAKGKCYIYFVRKKEELEKAFYTLELSPEGRILQCRGLKNCNMTPEVSEVVNAFSRMEQEKYEKEKKERKSA